MNKLLITGWGMYLVSFVLPFHMTDEYRWGYQLFWRYVEGFFDFEETLYLHILTVNLSNVVMILSPLLLRVFSARVLGVLLLLGGLHNARFLWWFLCDDILGPMQLFYAYYVWWISFFVVSFALLKSSKSPHQSESPTVAT